MLEYFNGVIFILEIKEGQTNIAIRERLSEQTFYCDGSLFNAIPSGAGHVAWLALFPLSFSSPFLNYANDSFPH